MLLFYRDAKEQAIRKRQLQRPFRYPYLLFPPSWIKEIRSFDVNMELSLSSVPSSGPNGEGLAPEFIDYPHPSLKSHRSYKT